MEERLIAAEQVDDAKAWAHRRGLKDVVNRPDWWHSSHPKAIGGRSTEIPQRECGKEGIYVEPTSIKYYDDPKDNIAFERCIEVMSRLMMKYGPTLLEKMEREKLSDLIQAEIELAADNESSAKRILEYYQLMTGRK